jgi:NADH-ubiquinone oxidoreductase chain 1
MIYKFTIISILDVLSVILPMLIAVAYSTVAERKTLASIQRRLGPNIVGYYGLFQAFADALKLLIKEYIVPSLANKIIFFVGAIITLIFSLLGYAMIPFAPGLAISDFDLGILYMLAVSSLSTYGILLAGWSANSKYAFLGALRSTAQLISYELIFTSAILILILIWGNLNLSIILESQKAVWSILPLLPIFIIFFICSIAETNRPPFDLVEAESELVSGYMTEHSAAIFVFFFLGEYASILLICILASILFLGGYLLNIKFIFNILYIPEYMIDSMLYYSYIIFGIIPDVVYSSFTLGMKSALLVFAFFLIRASFPRTRFDQLMSYCWTILLPLIVAFIIIIPCILFGLEIIPSNEALFGSIIIALKNKN